MTVTRINILIAHLCLYVKTLLESLKAPKVRVHVTPCTFFRGLISIDKSPLKPDFSDSEISPSSGVMYSAVIQCMLDFEYKHVMSSLTECLSGKISCLSLKQTTHCITLNCSLLYMYPYEVLKCLIDYSEQISVYNTEREYVLY